MSGPTHHVDDDLLLDYVTGAATEPVALLVACHLTLCAACRVSAAAAESVGGALLQQAPAAPLSEGALGRVLARLDEHPAPIAPWAPTASSDTPAASSGTDADQPFAIGGVALPRPMAHYLARTDARSPSGAAGFRFMAPGVRGIDLPTATPAGVRTRLLQFSAGMEIPLHAHAAPEFTIVFSGGFSDEDGHYGPADVRVRDTASSHAQRIDRDGPCVALVINEGALLPRTWRGRLVSLLFDR